MYVHIGMGCDKMHRAEGAMEQDGGEDAGEDIF